MVSPFRFKIDIFCSIFDAKENYRVALKGKCMSRDNNKNQFAIMRETIKDPRCVIRENYSNSRLFLNP